jgi:hypothetical protein
LKWSGKTVAASMLAEAGIPAVYAAEDSTIRLALIGCGGRGCGAATHSGKIITWDEAMASNFRFCLDIDRLTDDSVPPLQANARGRYPVPIPGQWT